jgi:hypothetical protein
MMMSVKCVQELSTVPILIGMWVPGLPSQK